MSNNYISNKSMYIEIIISKSKGSPTRELNRMLILLTERINRRFNYKNEKDRDDCKQEALYQVFKNWHLFNEDITQNVFAYFTEIIKRGHAKGFNQIYDRNKASGEYLYHLSVNNFYDDGEDLIL